MNRKLKLLLVPLAGLALLTATAIPVLAKGQGNGPSAPASAQAAPPPGGGGPAVKPPDLRNMVRGTVESVSGNIITFKSGNTLAVDANTKYTAPKKPKASLADVVKGVDIVARVKKTDTGPLAVQVQVLGKIIGTVVHSGTVTAYTAGASITITGPKGGPATFIINGDTKINLPKGIAGLKTGDSVTVSGRTDPDTKTLVAKVIAVHKVRMVEGTVTAITSGSLTVKPATGDPINFKTDKDTIFTLKGVSAVSVNDKVKVVAEVQEDGTLLAKAVMDGVSIPSMLGRFGPKGRQGPMAPNFNKPGPFTPGNSPSGRPIPKA